MYNLKSISINVFLKNKIRRYDSERDLFAMADDLNPDEVPEGWDIANETTSRFRKLLDNQILLDQFLNEDLHNSEHEIQTDFKNEILDDDDDENNNDPETSYLRISAHLRQALKKHLPWVNSLLFHY